MRGAGLVLRVHGIGEVDDLVGGQPVEQLVISRDEGGLPGLIRAGRQAFRALVFEAQAMQQRHATRRAVNHAPSRRDRGRHLAAVAHQPFAKPRRKLRHPFAAQVAASPLPIKHCHLVQAARLIALEPRPYRVVVEIERFRDLGTVPAIVQQQNRVRPARHTVDLTRMPHHRLQGRAFLGAQKSTANHGQRRTYPRTERKDFLEFPRRQSI